MESETTPAALQLADLRRAEVLTHTRYKRPGAWFPPASGLFAAVFTAAYALPLWASLVAWLGIMAVAGILIRLYLPSRGTFPDPQKAPEVIKRETGIFFVAYSFAIFLTMTSFMVIEWWAGSLVAFVSFALVVRMYERRFAQAAHKAEVDAGIIA